MEGKSLIRKIVFFCLLVSSALSFAQSAPSAEGGASSLWVGAEASMFNPDWGCPSSSPFSCGNHQLLGAAAFADMNRLLGPVGVEGEVRWLPWHGPAGLKQANILVGPRYQAFARRRVSINVKFLAGGAILYSDRLPSWQGWSDFVPGATFGYRLSPRLIVRADYEYQRWPGFAGPRGQHGLTPNGFSLGVSYRILR
jgi:hypothetical protein